MIAMKRVGIEGGFWTSSHREAFVRYPRVWKRLHICQRTFNGPAIMKGTLFARRRGGGGGKGTIVMRGLLIRPGCKVDSGHLVSGRKDTRPSLYTMVSNHIHSSTMFSYTHSMILHPRTAPNVSENQHLDGDLGLIGGALGGNLRRRMLDISAW